MKITDEFKKKALNSWRDLDTELKQQYINEARTGNPKENSAQFLDRLAFQKYLISYIANEKNEDYQKYPEGMITWVEENVRIPIKTGTATRWLYAGELSDERDEYGRSQHTCWESLKGELRKALQTDENGLLKYNLVVFCWPRGELKSFAVILIAIHRFFTFPFQNIRLSSNTIKMTDDVHMNEAKKIIENSPKLMKVLRKNEITETGIFLRKNKQRGIFNSIVPMSQVSGICSGSDVITQSEAFDTLNDKFFTRAFGSVRGTPNALYLIDTTAATQDHWLYRLMRAYQADPDGVIYFSHAENLDEDPACLRNPGVSKKQLNGFKAAFTKIEFAKFYKNEWKFGGADLFDQSLIEAFRYIGVDGKLTPHDDVMRIIDRKTKVNAANEVMDKRFKYNDKDYEYRADADTSGYDKLWDITTLYNFGDKPSDNEIKTIRNTAVLPGIPELNRLSDIYETDWAVLVGSDRAEALKSGDRLKAKTIVVTVLKGLPGSRGKSKNERINMSGEAAYMYILFGVADVLDSHSHSMVKVISDTHDNLDGVDMAFSETALMADVVYTLRQKGIPVDTKYASTTNQGMGFSELINAVDTGRFKTPFVPIPGSWASNIVTEEFAGFDVDLRGKTKVYGSPTKMKKNGVQDDFMFALGWAICGGIGINADQFKPRATPVLGDFGGLFPGMELIQDLVGNSYHR